MINIWGHDFSVTLPSICYFLSYSLFFPKSQHLFVPLPNGFLHFLVPGAALGFTDPVPSAPAAFAPQALPSCLRGLGSRSVCLPDWHERFKSHVSATCCNSRENSPPTRHPARPPGFVQPLPPIHGLSGVTVLIGAPLRFLPSVDLVHSPKKKKKDFTYFL